MPATEPTAATHACKPLRVAIVGAESTGKSVLAHALADTLARELGLRCAVVDEYLRDWCVQQDRTPRVDEQRGIALEHARLIEAAARQPGLDVLLCDTTPLMVSVYSDLLFDDRSLDDVALACQRRMDITLLTSLDIPWVADGLQREGPHVRPPVDVRVRARLVDWGGPWSVVSGAGVARTTNAVDALRPLLRSRLGNAGQPVQPPDEGAGEARLRWHCERCDDPFFERLLPKEK